MPVVDSGSGDSGVDAPIGSPSHGEQQQVQQRAASLGLSVGEYTALRGITPAPATTTGAPLGVEEDFGSQPVDDLPDPSRRLHRVLKSARTQGSTARTTTLAVDTMDDGTSDDDASTEEGDATWEEYDVLLEDAATAATPADFLAAIADAMDVADFLAVDESSTQRLSDTLVTSVSRYFRKSRGLPPLPDTRSTSLSSRQSLRH